MGALTDVRLAYSFVRPHSLQALPAAAMAKRASTPTAKGRSHPLPSDFAGTTLRLKEHEGEVLAAQLALDRLRNEPAKTPSRAIQSSRAKILTMNAPVTRHISPELDTADYRYSFILGSGVEVAGLTYVGAKQYENEDTYGFAFTMDGAQYHILFDGSGNSLDGSMASIVFCKWVGMALAAGFEPDEAIAMAATSLNTDLKSRLPERTNLQELPERETPYCTALISKYWNEKDKSYVKYFHAGDSKAVVYSRNAPGELVELARTKDHSWIAEARQDSMMLLNPLADKAHKKEASRFLLRFIQRYYSRIRRKDLDGEHLNLLNEVDRRIHDHPDHILVLDPNPNEAFNLRLRAAGYLVTNDDEQRRNLRADLLTLKADHRGIYDGARSIPLPRTEDIALEGCCFNVEASDALWGLFTSAGVADIIKDCTSAVEARDALFKAVITLTDIVRPELQARHKELNVQLRILTAEEPTSEKLPQLRKETKQAWLDMMEIVQDNLTIIVRYKPE
jgi:serine/threonine protein phosphatase PrpC